MNNLHVTLTPFTNESRLKKQAVSLVDRQVMQRVFVAALWEDGLDLEGEFYPGCKYQRFSLRSRKWGGSLPVQIIKYFEFIIRVVFFARKKNIRVVNAHALSLLPVCYLVSIFTGAEIIYDAHELETERHGLSGIRKKLSVVIEKLFIGKCKHVFVVGEKIADFYRNRYSIDNVTAIMNCPDLDGKVVKTDKLRSEFELSHDTVVYIYQGLLSTGRGLDVILETFAGVKNKKLCLVVMGYGELKSEVLDYALRHSNIFYKDAVAPDNVLQYTASADVGLCLIEPVCLSYRYALPNKLFEYTAAGLKIIASDLPEIRNVVKGGMHGITVEDITVDQVSSAVENIITLFHSQASEETVLIDEYRWSYQADKMIKVYNRIFI